MGEPYNIPLHVQRIEQTTLLVAFGQYSANTVIIFTGVDVDSEKEKAV